MSDSQAYEELTVASDGVSVAKRFEEDEFPVPAIAFEFNSSRDEEVHVELTDTVPEGIEVEDLGFHPEYGSEHWVINDDNTIAFERDLAPGESYTTVYGIRATGSDNVEQFLTEPALEEVDPPLPGDATSADVIPDSDDDVLKEAIAGDGEIPGLERGDDGDGEDIEKLDLKDPNDPGDSGDTTTAPEGGSGEDGSVAVEGSVVAAMAEEIRQQEVSADDVKLLRKALDMAGEDGATAAKVDQIQDDVADLRAYTGALEEFLGENGTGEQILDEFEERMTTFESRVSAVRSTLEDNGERLDSVTATVEGFDEDIQSLGDDIESVGEEVRSLSDRVDDVTGEVDSMDERFEDLEDALEGLESDLEELEEDITEGEVAERVDEIEKSIDDLQEWQEQIKQTFGG